MEENKDKKTNNRKIINVLLGVVIGVLLASTTTLSILYANKKGGSTVIPPVADVEYTVTYVDDGAILYTETVKQGNDVKNVPEVPTTLGYDSSWSNDGKNVQSNLVITVIDTPKTYNIYYFTNYVNPYQLKKSMLAVNFKIYNWNGQPGMSDIAVKYDGYNKENKTFVLFGDTYYFNDGITALYRDAELTDLFADVNQYWMYINGIEFEFTADYSEVFKKDYIYFDESLSFRLNDKFYQYEEKRDAIIEVETNQRVTTDTIYSDVGDAFEYRPFDNSVCSFNGETYDVAEVIDHHFEMNGHNYVIYPETMTYYQISKVEAGWKTGCSAPTKVTYTYGEDLVFDDSIFGDNAKYVWESSGEITKSSDTCGGYDSHCGYEGIYILQTSKYIRPYKINGGTTLINPLGDIYVYPDFAPGSI